jgi:3-dehydroquinate synthase
MAERGVHGDVVVVSDTNVAPHWSYPLLDAFAQAGVRATLVTLPAGEAHKHLDTVRRLYDRFLDAELDRSGVVVALGGGVIGDMAGFADATYMRGVRFVQIPTTLLAMVDASVGGKTGVDLPQGKNLVGAFKQPELVIIDPDLLTTLPSEEFRNGLAEVIKHGIIADPELFAQLESAGPSSLEALIARALRVKIGIVERDPFEAGERAHLNLGHTFAHAIERVSNYAIPHGVAVGLGLIAAARLAAARGVCASELPARVERVVERLGLPTTLSGYAPAAIVAAMRSDKKRKGGRLRFVLPRAIGDVGLYDDVPEEDVLAAVASLMPSPEG